MRSQHELQPDFSIVAVGITTRRANDRSGLTLGLGCKIGSGGVCQAEQFRLQNSWKESFVLKL